MNRLFISSILVLSTLGACNKDDSSTQQLPPPTQQGKNILACKVNGQVHIYSGKRTTFNDNGVNYDLYLNKLRLYADNIDYRDNIEIVFPVNPDSIKVGLKYFFDLADMINPFGEYRIRVNGVTNEYKTGKQSGFIQFTRLDKDVAAGIFQFTAYYNNDSVTITEGRFDITNP